jgi:aldehyde:ferredoxin oxidoreductase
MKRLINIKMGLTPEEDRVPRILTTTFESGGSAGISPDFEHLKKSFYKYRDWDLETGKPSNEKLRQRGLDMLG